MERRPRLAHHARGRLLGAQDRQCFGTVLEARLHLYDPWWRSDAHVSNLRHGPERACAMPVWQQGKRAVDAEDAPRPDGSEADTRGSLAVDAGSLARSGLAPTYIRRLLI